MASQPPRPSSSPKYSDKGETASSLKYLNKRTSSLKYGGKDGKTAPQQRSVQPPLVPGAEGALGRRRLPWMTLIRAVGRFQRLISEVRQSQTLSFLNPLAMELDVPQQHPIQEKNFWGDQEPLSKIPFQIFSGHQQLVSSCHFCVNDTKLLSGSFDYTVKLWVGGGSKASCQLTLPLVESSPVLKSRSQGSQGFGEAFLSKVQEGETKTRAHMNVKPLERDEDAMDGSIIRDFDDGPKAPVLECSVTADSRRITAAAYDKTLRTWDLETGKLLWKIKHEGFITSCNFSPDGKYVVSGLDVDHGICITDARNAMTVAHIKDHHKRSVTGCCFDPDSQKVASVSLDKSVKIWDITSQATLLTINTAHDNAVSSCCFTFSGHFLCTSSWDKTLKIWNVHTGEFRNQGACATLMHGHEGSVSSCQFARDTSFLVSGGFDKTVAIWDVGEGYLKHSLKGHNDWVMDVAISNNKKWILSASKDKTMRLWNIEEIDQIPLVIKCKEARGLKVNQCEACERPFSTYDSDVFSETVTKCVFCRMDASLSAEASSSSKRKDSPARECSLGKDN